MTALSLAVFDVNETVFSLERLGAKFGELGLPSHALQIWFARVLRDGFALTCVDRSPAFRDLARTHLRALLREAGAEHDDDALDDILAVFATLDAHPDVEPAFRRLRDAGVRVVTLTNGHADTTTALLERNGLAGYVERCLSVDDVGVWKPRPEPYLHAARVCGVDVGRAAMVAVHSWDVDGAKRAGLRTGYASRLEGSFVDAFLRPDVVGSDLVEVADGLIADSA